MITICTLFHLAFITEYLQTTIKVNIKNILLFLICILLQVGCIVFLPYGINLLIPFVIMNILYRFLCSCREQRVFLLLAIEFILFSIFLLPFSYFFSSKVLFLFFMGVLLVHFLFLNTSSFKYYITSLEDFFNVKKSYFYFLLVIISLIYISLSFLSLYHEIHFHIFLVLYIFFLGTLFSVHLLRITSKKCDAIKNEKYSYLKKQHDALELEHSRVKHNLVNNLLAIKSAEQYEISSLIMQLIHRYKRDYEIIGNLTTIKKGLEGIIDFKFQEAINKGIHCYLKIQDGLDIHELLKEHYFPMCEIVGIAIDNAIEGSLEAEEKIVFVDISYEEHLEIKIMNSFSNLISVDELFHGIYSTKGRESGYGLNYIYSLEASSIQTLVQIQNSLFIFTILV